MGHGQVQVDEIFFCDTTQPGHEHGQDEPAGHAVVSAQRSLRGRLLPVAEQVLGNVDGFSWEDKHYQQDRRSLTSIIGWRFPFLVAHV